MALEMREVLQALRHSRTPADLLLRVHLLPGVHGGHERRLPELRGRGSSPARANWAEGFVRSIAVFLR